jgi:hypothetical protein
MAREQQDEQLTSVEPRPKKPARVQHPEDESPYYEPQKEHPSVKHKGDEQAAEHGEAQTHHEAESRMLGTELSLSSRGRMTLGVEAIFWFISHTLPQCLALQGVEDTYL